jgi:hypothetical protein
MPEFQGTIRLEDGDGLASSLLIDDGRLLVTAGEHEIGNWAINELSAVRQNGEFRLNVEDDELVVGVNDPVGLSEALGIKDDAPKQRRVKKPKAEKKSKRNTRSQPEETPPVASLVVEAPVSSIDTAPVPVASIEQAGAEKASLWTRLSPRTKLIGAGAIGLVVLGVFAPSILALLMLLVGMVTLFLGIAARSDSGTGFLPPPFFATTTAAAGGIGLVLLAVVIIAMT